ncbi:pyridoxal-phosphate dependent enzyme [Streptomyces sp. ST2-7A]|uniref:pyridoxal-phosphate dependent enzyme n=1 Tax=Streptomyces sp. ST2-7A TaxID=2907214 RepID=UPI001F1BEB2A|nr:pyridoxal-phosphate dependent enzyme [Streptomyces sp. ST2-7A]MCE7082318.1 pyridoxal-phosphate dependent enzyme [Streptomyces sp. ST2-7A]
MTASVTRLGPADVRAAASRISPHVRRTPLTGVLRGTLPGLLLKAEHLQHGGSFKIRGAANALLGPGVRRIVTGSSGNHGIALARLAAPLGAEVTVVMAAGANPAKAALIRALGARTVTVPGDVVDREERARSLAERTGATLVPSSDHELVVAGQGTVGAEILADAPDTGTLYVPVGGGGLLAGVCLAARDHRVRIVGVEPAALPRYARSLEVGHPVLLPWADTVADGLRGRCPGEVTYPIVRDRVDSLITVDDSEITAAMTLLHRHGVRAEPTGAVALAGVLRDGARGRAVAVVSGGNGVRPPMSAVPRPRSLSNPAPYRGSPRPLPEARPRGARPGESVRARPGRDPRGDTVTTHARPTTADVTELLVAAFREALDLPECDEHSDFYELGGDSLTAFRITAHVQEALDIEVPVALLFAYPTPAELADVIEADFTDA